MSRDRPISRDQRETGMQVPAADGNHSCGRVLCCWLVLTCLQAEQLCLGSRRATCPKGSSAATALVIASAPFDFRLVVSGVLQV